MRKFYKRGIALFLGAALLVSNNVNTVMATELPDSVTESITESLTETLTEALSGITGEGDAQTEETADTGELISGEDTSVTESVITADNPYGTEEGDGTGEDYSDIASDSYAGYSTDYPNTWTNTGDQATDITQIALTQVGYTESEGNHTKYAVWWCGSDTAYAWCGIFISWCADQAGIPTSIIRNNGLASGYNESNMDSNSFGCPAYAFSSTSAKVGDIIYVDSTGNGLSNHVGLVYAVDSTYIYTVEGNYSDKVSLVKYQVSTGCRQLSSYTSSAHILFYARPSYNGQASTGGSTTTVQPSETVSTQSSETASTQTVSSETSQTDTSLGLYKVTASSLNVRTGPATSYSKRGTLEQGTVVEVYEISNGWGKIQYGGDSGWISMSYTEKVEEGTASSESPASTQTTQTSESTQSTQTGGTSSQNSVTYPVYTTSQALNIHSGPGTSYSTIGTLASGTSVTILEKSGSYGRFDYSGQDGWIYLGYCTQTGTVTVSSDTNSETSVSESQTTQTTESQTTQTSDSQTSQTTESQTTQTTQSTETADYETGYYMVNTSSLNVREGPGTSYAKLGIIEAGYVFEATETNGRWGKFDYNGTTGWTSLAYCVKTTKPEETSETETQTETQTEETLRIVSQPQDVVVNKCGDTAEITLTASGSGLTYTWYYKNASASSFSKSSITTNTYTAQVTSERNYRQVYCMVSDKNGNTVKSDIATMSYRKAPEITEQPQSVMVKSGETVSITVKATGSGLNYRWYYRNPTSTSYVKSSTTTNTYSITMNDSRNGRMVYCVITDQYGNSVTSNAAAMGITGSFLICQQPQDVVVAKAGAVANISVTAIGDGLSYTWYYKNAGDSKFLKSSITTNTYSYAVTKSRNGRQVYCVITDANGNTLTTNTVTMSIKQ